MGIRIETYSVLVSIALGAGLLVSLAALSSALRRRAVREGTPAATPNPDRDREALDAAFAAGKLDWAQYRIRRDLLREARHVAAITKGRQPEPPRPAGVEEPARLQRAHLRTLALAIAVVGMAALVVDVSPFDPFSARTLSWSPGVTILLVGMAAAVARRQRLPSD